MDHHQAPSPHSSLDASSQDAPNEPASALGCLLRLIWMLLGNAGLVALALLITKQPRWSFSFLDAAYALLVLGLLGARFADITRFGGMTTSNEPATLKHFSRYAPRVVLIAAAMWILAHLAAA